ncbi:MAG: hypothetical protein ACJ79I_13475, partial [Gemmatimonadaceae bacterium]
AAALAAAASFGDTLTNPQRSVTAAARGAAKGTQTFPTRGSAPSSARRPREKGGAASRRTTM